MPHPNPDASNATASSIPAQDTQALIGLLGNLMPLLLQLQSQTTIELYPSGPTGLMLQNPLLDQQAAVNLTEDLLASSLRTLSGYLDLNAGRYPGLESCVTIATQAARGFAMRDYAQAFALIWQAYRVIAILRATNPQIPALRTAAPDPAPFPAPTGSMH